MAPEAKDYKTARTAFLGIGFVVFPAISFLLGLPLVLAWLESGVQNVNVVMLALASGMALGLLSAPGYFVAAFEADDLLGLRRRSWWWIWISLIGVFTASLVAIPFTLFLGPVLVVFPAGTAVLSLVLMQRSTRL